jgi:hypothetical protein
MSSKKSEIVVAAKFVALAPQDLVDDGLFSSDELAGSMGAKGFGPGDLERIKIPAGGGTTWDIIDESSKTIDVVIVAAQDVRVFYVGKYTGGNEPPDCASLDCIIGLPGENAPGEITGDCSTCPKARWGSAVSDSGEEGKGQACKQRKMMLLYREQDRFPLVLSVPSSSLKQVQKYFGRLVSGFGRPYWGVVTRLSLEKAKSSGNIEYSSLVLEFVRTLEAEEVETVRKLREQFVPALERRMPEAQDAA